MKKNKKKEKDMPCLEEVKTSSEELAGATDETVFEAAEETVVEAVTVSNTSEESPDTSASEGNTASPESDADSESESDTDGESEDTVKTKKEKAPRKSGEASPVRLIVTLAAICVAIAVLLGGVNLITRVRITKAAEKEKTNAILAVFKGGDKSKLVKTTDSGDEIHLVFKDNVVLGYCVFTTAQGFGGDIKMIVGIDAEYNTLGVKIISMSETPGVGTKTNTLGFLDRFIGKPHSAPTDGVEAIAGATISSDAIKSAVAAAHKIEFDLIAAADAEGSSVITENETDTDKADTPDTPATQDTTIDTSVEQGTDSDTPSSEPDSVDPTESVTGSDPTEETSDLPFYENAGGRGYYVYGVGVGTSYDRYVIELTKVTDESGEIIYDPVEVTTEAPTQAPTEPPVIDPVTSETTGIVSIPIITTGPESSVSSMGSVTAVESEPVSEPESSDEVPTEPIPETPTDTTPVSPDTSDPNGDKEPVVRPGISIGGRTVGN